MGTVAHANEIVDNPITSTLPVRITRAPYRSSAQPTTGEATVAASPPTLAAPAIRVRLQPKSSDIGKMNTARVRLAAAFLTTIELPAAKRMFQP
tara:strand:- start:690 stop:971 length:282 start_codon:yes stop_codon:yes gene_type:complete